jgi:hypothetical protein
MWALVRRQDEGAEGFQECGTIMVMSYEELYNLCLYVASGGTID